jgi:hypothetical protein
LPSETSEKRADLERDPPAVAAGGAEVALEVLALGEGDAVREHVEPAHLLAHDLECRVHLARRR